MQLFYDVYCLFQGPPWKRDLNLNGVLNTITVFFGSSGAPGYKAHSKQNVWQVKLY